MGQELALRPESFAVVDARNRQEPRPPRGTGPFSLSCLDHYLRPFAKILLALAALREKQPDVARTELNDLVAEFPENPLFASELAKLNVSPATPNPPQLSDTVPFWTAQSNSYAVQILSV